MCSTSFEQSKPTCPCNVKKKEIGVSRRRPISLRRSRPTDSNQDSSESNIILLAYIRPRARSTLMPLLRYTVIICIEHRSWSKLYKMFNVELFVTIYLNRETWKELPLLTAKQMCFLTLRRYRRLKSIQGSDSPTILSQIVAGKFSLACWGKLDPLNMLALFSHLLGPFIRGKIRRVLH